jgi:hypothetical protein
MVKTKAWDNSAKATTANPVKSFREKIFSRPDWKGTGTPAWKGTGTPDWKGTGTRTTDGGKCSAGAAGGGDDRNASDV